MLKYELKGNKILYIPLVQIKHCLRLFYAELVHFRHFTVIMKARKGLIG